MSISFVGWGPHAYFQVLVNTSSNNSDNLYAQRTEVQNVSVCIPPQHDGDNAQVNRLDSNPTLDGSQIARTLTM